MAKVGLKIFTMVTDMAEWLARQQGVTTILHFLYDFLVIDHTESAEVVAYVMLLLLVFEHLGIPVAVEKVEGSCSVIIFPGIELAPYKA